MKYNVSNPRPLPAQEELLKAFRYEDGKLFHRIDKRGGAKAGNRVGCVDLHYRRVWFAGKLWREHRLIFMMIRGFCPNYIDHIDQDKLNNRIENLRKANASQNGTNRGRSSNNKSGTKGVSWNKTHKIWRAQIMSKGVRSCLGTYKDFFEACCAAHSARNRLHGEFASHN